MCGRYSFFASDEEWSSWARENLQRPPELPDDYTASYNIAPQDSVMSWAPQLEESRLVSMTWGFMPHYANNRGDSIINARADQVLRNDAWNESFRERRCLVPADGYYEWSGDSTPYRVRREDDEPFLMAGLWREWQPSQEQLTLGDNIATDSYWTAAIITTDANRLVDGIHDRMPAIIEPRNAENYLDGPPEEAQELLNPYGADDLEVYEVSEKVNDPVNDDPDVVRPAGS